MCYLPCFRHIPVNHGDGVTPDHVSVEDELMDGGAEPMFEGEDLVKNDRGGSMHLGTMNLNRIRRERTDQGYQPGTGQHQEDSHVMPGIRGTSSHNLIKRIKNEVWMSTCTPWRQKNSMPPLTLTWCQCLSSL